MNNIEKFEKGALNGIGPAGEKFSEKFVKITETFQALFYFYEKLETLFSTQSEPVS